MPKGEEWVDKRVSEAKKAHPAVTDGASDRMKELLRAEISEGHLPPTKLAKIASTLIADMDALVPQKAEVDHED